MKHRAATLTDTLIAARASHEARVASKDAAQCRRRLELELWLIEALIVENDRAVKR